MRLAKTMIAGVTCAAMGATLASAEANAQTVPVRWTDARGEATVIVATPPGSPVGLSCATPCDTELPRGRTQLSVTRGSGSPWITSVEVPSRPTEFRLHPTDGGRIAGGILMITLLTPGAFIGAAALAFSGSYGGGNGLLLGTAAVVGAGSIAVLVGGIYLVATAGQHIESSRLSTTASVRLAPVITPLAEGGAQLGLVGTF